MSEQYVIEFLVFHTYREIPSSPAAFLFLIFLSTESSSRVNGPSLMSNCILIILVITLTKLKLVGFEGFSRRGHQCRV